MSNKYRIFLIISIILLLCISVTLLVSCQSVDKSESTLNYRSLKFNYDEQTDTTRIIWNGHIINNTIFSINGFTIHLDLYSGSGIVYQDLSIDYSTDVPHGKEIDNNFNFTVEGNISSASFLSWTADYLSFWQTYKIWIIVCSVITAVASIAYIIAVIIIDVDLDNTALWLIPSLLPLAISAIYSGVMSNWVPFVIILVAVIAFILIILVAHLIKYICDYGIDWPSFGRSYVLDIDDLDSFTVAELKDRCRAMGFTGYSRLKKAELIALLSGKQITADNVNSEKNKPQSKQKTTKNNKQINKIYFDDIAGLDDVKQAFKEKIVLPLEHKELYAKYHKKLGGGILLYGLPGTGKTMFAQAAANEIDALFIPINCADIKSKWYGESEENIHKIFNKARKAERAIIFFDEFEAIGAKRNDDNSNGNNDLVPQILAEMQGVNSDNTTALIVVIAATNRPWAIDSAFLRPGRFDEKIYIPLPDHNARKKMFELKLKSIPFADINYDKLADLSAGYNGADITNFCEKLKMLAIKKSISSNSEYTLTMQDADDIAESTGSSVFTEDLEMINNFIHQN